MPTARKCLTFNIRSEIRKYDWHAIHRSIVGVIRTRSCKVTVDWYSKGTLAYKREMFLTQKKKSLLEVLDVELSWFTRNKAEEEWQVIYQWIPGPWMA